MPQRRHRCFHHLGGMLWPRPLTSTILPGHQYGIFGLSLLVSSIYHGNKIWSVEQTNERKDERTHGQIDNNAFTEIVLSQKRKTLLLARTASRYWMAYILLQCFSTFNLWGHWTDLNQTWTHIQLWQLFEKLVLTPSTFTHTGWKQKPLFEADFELWPNISLQRAATYQLL